jgi:metal-responsive CopG/Arc/MetJ family transcriptional regulator
MNWLYVNGVHQMSEYLRVTVVLPKKLWEDVKQRVPVRKRSRLVAEALEAELRRRERREQLERLAQFQDYMRQKYGELPGGAESIQETREERDDEIAGLR